MFNTYDASKQLFQKVYYNPKLTSDDELQLREAFIKANSSHDQTRKVLQGGLFLAYWPITYYISRTIRPSSVLLFTAFYYFGVYKLTLDKLALKNF